MVGGRLRVLTSNECETTVIAKLGIGRLERLVITPFEQDGVSGGTGESITLLGTSLERMYSVSPLDPASTCKITVHANVSYGSLEVRDGFISSAASTQS